MSSQGGLGSASSNRPGSAQSDRQQHHREQQSSEQAKPTSLYQRLQQASVGLDDPPPSYRHLMQHTSQPKSQTLGSEATSAHAQQSEGQAQPLTTSQSSDSPSFLHAYDEESPASSTTSGFTALRASLSQSLGDSQSHSDAGVTSSRVVTPARPSEHAYPASSPTDFSNTAQGTLALSYGTDVHTFDVSF